MSARAAHFSACLTHVALLFLGLAWELWLAPQRPGGSWLLLKIVPLLFPLMGILRGRRYTFQWSSLLIWAYFAEGVVRVVTEPPPASILAGIEVALALGFFASVVVYLRSPGAS